MSYLTLFQSCYHFYVTNNPRWFIFIEGAGNFYSRFVCKLAAVVSKNLAIFHKFQTNNTDQRWPFRAPSTKINYRRSLKYEGGYNFETRSNRTHDYVNLFHCVCVSCPPLKWAPHVMKHPVCIIVRYTKHFDTSSAF